jgi:hypothetical protein
MMSNSSAEMSSYKLLGEEVELQRFREYLSLKFVDNSYLDGLKDIGSL